MGSIDLEQEHVQLFSVGLLVSCGAAHSRVLKLVGRKYSFTEAASVCVAAGGKRT